MSKSKSRNNSGQKVYRETLALATERLERAEVELARGQQKCVELSAEIPQLRDVISVMRRLLGIDKAKHEVEGKQLTKPRRPNLMDRLPEDIKQFLKPRADQVETVLESRVTGPANGAAVELSDNEEDRFLTNMGGGGEEVLP